jgi:hypothetical protein
VGSRPALYITKKGALDSQPQVIKFTGWWFSPGAPASSTTKTGLHDIAEIMLKMALNKINQNYVEILISAHSYNSPSQWSLLTSTFCCLFKACSHSW